MISIFSPKSSSTTARTRIPFGPISDPAGSTSSYSVADSPTRMYWAQPKAGLAVSFTTRKQKPHWTASTLALTPSVSVSATDVN